MTIPVQICDFCQQEAAYVPLPVNNTGRNLAIHFCKPCGAEYVYWCVDGERAATHLYVVINDKTYRWTTYPTRAAAFLAYIEEPGIPGIRPNQKIKNLQKFIDHPFITPQNINEKIRFMLPFL